MILRSLLAVLMLAACSGTSWALDVSEMRWGFDGRATPQCFNLLSVLVNNHGPEPFDGRLELRESIGAGSHVGAALVEEVYVAPYSSRWVQFYPYVKEHFEDWSLQWGRRPGESADVPRHVVAEQKPVLLVDPDDPPGKSGGIRQFPENLFPPAVTATDGLTGVALDHVPRWEEARRQAFYDWLYRGGRLDLFHDINGSYPQFSATLAELNTPAEKFQVGNGHVFRHARMRSQIDSDFMAKTLGAKSSTRDKSPGPVDTEEEVNVGVGAGNVTARRTGQFTGAQEQALFPDIAGGLFSFLKSLTRPNHNWTLIYSMALVYVLTVVPGVHLLGRKRFDYRIVYGALLGLIVLFSFGFAYFGRRGHKEANAVNTVAVARQLAGGASDITSWSNVFVINGADYDIVHGGSGRLYSTAQTFEAVNGFILNGAVGRFDVDIPPFSSQPFTSRMKLRQEPAEFKIQEFAGTPKLTKLVLAPGANFPQPAGADSAWIVCRDQIAPMTWSKGRLELTGAGRALSQFLESVQWTNFSPYAMRFNNFRGGNPQESAPFPFEPLMRPLVAWSLHLRRQSDIPEFHLADDRLCLLVWADLPDRLKVQGPRFTNQKGRVLYVYDIPKPVKP